jgi:hypothetical protein
MGASKNSKKRKKHLKKSEAYSSKKKKKKRVYSLGVLFNVFCAPFSKEFASIFTYRKGDQKRVISKDDAIFRHF